MKKGYIEDAHGYTGAFSWWRTTNEVWGKWYVCGHTSFARSGCAVADDFGTLVEVPD